MDKIRKFCGFYWCELVEKFQKEWMEGGRDFVETLEKSAPFTKNTSLNMFSSNLEKNRGNRRDAEEKTASKGHYN